MGNLPSQRLAPMGWKLPTAVIGAFALIAASFFWLFRESTHVWTNDSFIDGYQISISPDIEARIIQLFVDEGSIVKKGDLLCQLDESIFNSRKKDAETNVTFLKDRVRLQKIQMEKLRDIYDVAKQEYEKEIISWIAFDKIEKNYHYAEMQLRVAEANFENGIAKLGVIEELLRHTQITAPRDGLISKRWVVAGDAAKYGQPLFSLTDTDVWITANLEETKVEHLKSGERVKIHVDAYPGQEFKGHVYVVRAAAASQFALIPPDTATGNFTKVVQRVPVKILFDLDEDQKNYYLYPGMSVEVTIKVR